MRPKGKLLIIGGAEDKGEHEFLDKERRNIKFQRYEILKELLINSKNKNIEIITTASRVPQEVRHSYEKAFHKIHYPNPGFISIRKRSEAKNKDYIKRIEHADAVFFTGGDQFRLHEIIGDTEISEIIREKYLHENNFLIAGTSAGAMAMSSIMIVSGGKEEALVNLDLETCRGLELLPNCIVDTHFIKRGRFARLAHAVILNPSLLGVGLGEDTAMIIKNGSEAECRGSGMVVIIDGKNIGRTNISLVKENEPIFVENLKVHLLVKGCSFSFKTRKLSKLSIDSVKKN